VTVGADGRELSARGIETRNRLIEAAEQVFADVGYHDASIVKITEAAGVGQGTFYLYFASKKDVFAGERIGRGTQRALDVRRTHHHHTTRIEAELLGFGAYFRFTAEHPALYRIIRQAEFVSPDSLRFHYEKITEGYVEGLREAMARGEVAEGDPEVLAWALMAAGEMLGMRWLLWNGRDEMPAEVLNELDHLLVRMLQP